MARIFILLIVGSILLALTGSVGSSAEREWLSVTQDSTVKCPTIVEIDTAGPNAVDEIRAVTNQLVKRSYPTTPQYQEWEIRRIAPLTQAKAYYGIAETLCGAAVADRSWLIELRFPKFEPSASLSQGQLFVAKIRGQWTTWYKYH